MEAKIATSPKSFRMNIDYISELSHNNQSLDFNPFNYIIMLRPHLSKSYQFYRHLNKVFGEPAKIGSNLETFKTIFTYGLISMQTFYKKEGNLVKTTFSQHMHSAPISASRVFSN